MSNKNTLSNKAINQNLIDNSNNPINNNIIKNNSRCNSSYDRSLQQSPKIGTGKYRPQSSRLKPFSLIDIDDKKILSKGTNIPAQHKRLPEDELKKFIDGIEQKAGDNILKKNLIKNFINKNENIKDKNNNINNNNEKENEKKENIINNNKKKSGKNLTIETKNTYDTKNINRNNTKKIKKQLEETKNIKSNFNRPMSAQLRQKKDRWLPKGYPHYEYCVLNQKYFQENLKKNPFIKKEETYNIKDIQQKSNQSDIFFLGPYTEKETKLLVIQDKDRAKNYNVKLGSDIFNLKKDFTNLMKSSETFLYKNKNYPISTESKSFWTPRANIPTYMNSPSVEYNILNPGAKCNTKTKEQINNECMMKKNDDNKNVVNYMNPIFRQKNMSNFYDITKGGMNRNFAYEKIYRDNPRSYYRKNDLCTLQCNLHHTYKGLSERPLMTQINKKIQF